jgi:nitrite reductase/ring-hydroxylating ferredoxin subunit
MENDNWQPVGPTRDVGDEMVMRTLGRKKIMLLRIDGSVKAFDAMCPHAGGPMDRGDLFDAIVTCPLHGWRFDLRKNGEETHGFACLRTFQVRDDGDQLFIQF